LGGVISAVARQSVVLGSLETYASNDADAPEIEAVHHIARGDALDQIKVVIVATLRCGLGTTRSGDRVEQATVCGKVGLDFVPADSRPDWIVTVVVVLIREAVEELACQGCGCRVHGTPVNLVRVIEFVSVAKVKAGFERAGMGTDVIVLLHSDRALKVELGGLSVGRVLDLLKLQVGGIIGLRETERSKHGEQEIFRGS
jgi:hypothetical protein